jgi:hypothetical protein
VRAPFAQVLAEASGVDDSTAYVLVYRRAPENATSEIMALKRV